MPDSIAISTADDDIRYVPAESAQRGFSELAHESRYRWLSEHIDLHGKSVLDFGCGSGYGTAFLASHAGRIIGMDISSAAIDYAKGLYASGNCLFQQSDLTSAELVQRVQDRFDVIVSFDVIEHVERYWDFMSNIRRLLKPDGVLVIGCPNRLATFDYNNEWNPFHMQEFTPHQLRWLAELYFGQVQMLGQDFVDEGARAAALARPLPPKAHLKRFIKAALPQAWRQAWQRRRQLRRSHRAAVHPAIGQPATFSMVGIAFAGLDMNSQAACRRPFGLIAVCSRPLPPPFSEE